MCGSYVLLRHIDIQRSPKNAGANAAIDNAKANGLPSSVRIRNDFVDMMNSLCQRAFAFDSDRLTYEPSIHIRTCDLDCVCVRVCVLTFVVGTCSDCVCVEAAPDKRGQSTRPFALRFNGSIEQLASLQRSQRRQSGPAKIN